MTIKETVGQNLKAARLQKNLKQSDLAGLIKTTQKQITRYESGEQDMTVSRLRQIEKALDLPTGSLLKNT